MAEPPLEQRELLETLCLCTPGRGCVLNNLERRIATGLVRRGLVKRAVSPTRHSEWIYRATSLGREVMEKYRAKNMRGVGKNTLQQEHGGTVDEVST